MQYRAMILRSHTAAVIFRMTYECHTSLTLSLYTFSFIFSQKSLSRSPSVSGCLLRLTGARGRKTALFVSALQTGGPLGRMGRSLPEEPCFSLRAAPDPHSQKKPCGSVSQLTEAFLSRLAFVSEILRRPQMGLARMDVSAEAVMRILSLKYEAWRQHSEEFQQHFLE